MTPSPGFRRYRIGGGWLLALLLAGCAAPDASTAKPDAPAEAPLTGRLAADQGRVEGVVLGAALLPSGPPQPVRIHLHDARETRIPGVPQDRQVLDIDIRATLSPLETPAELEVHALLKFDRIVVSFHPGGEPDRTLRYDSAGAAGAPGGGDERLAVVMEPVAGAELLLRISRTAGLLEVVGLDLRWNEARVLLVEPELLAVQWAFRDATMLELLSEALFPPMPAHAVVPGETWEQPVPANLAMAARLTARLTNRRAPVEGAAAGAPRVTIVGEGPIEPSPPVLEGREPGIRPEVEDGTQRTTLRFDPDARRFTQESRRDLKLRVAMVPPAGDVRPEMTIHQLRTLKVTRGAVENE